MSDAITRWLDIVTNPDVVTAVRVIDAADINALTDDERRVVAGARPQRRAEFASGRAALHAITGDPESIGIGEDGRPLAPAGWVASVAHDAHLVVAIAALAVPAQRTIGIDVEMAGGLTAIDAEEVIGDDDHAPWHDPVAALVAKEAAFKAWATHQPERLRRANPERWPNDWHDLSLRCAPVGGGVAVSLRCDATQRVIDVSVAEIDGRWLAVADCRW